MEARSVPPATPPQPGEIVGHVTSWYFYRRMGPMVLVLLGMGLYFLYDGKIGYPKANAVAAQKVWLETEVHESHGRAKATGGPALETWMREAKDKNWPLDNNGAPLRWVSWAAERGLPERPKHWTDAEIHQQYWFGGGCILAALAVACVTLRNRGRTVRAGADHWTTPQGRRVAFASVFRLDVRKWNAKGLAYAWYRDADTGRVRRAVLDDFKFTRMQPILDRLRANFSGELIEKSAPETASEANTRESIR